PNARHAGRTRRDRGTYRDNKTWASRDHPTLETDDASPNRPATWIQEPGDRTIYSSYSHLHYTRGAHSHSARERTTLAYAARSDKDEAGACGTHPRPLIPSPTPGQMPNLTTAQSLSHRRD